VPVGEIVQKIGKVDLLRQWRGREQGGADGSVGDPARLWKDWFKVATAIPWGNDSQGKPYLDRFCAVDVGGTKHVASQAIA
jgi:hypothetical protein